MDKIKPIIYKCLFQVTVIVGLFLLLIYKVHLPRWGDGIQNGDNKTKHNKHQGKPGLTIYQSIKT